MVISKTAFLSIPLNLEMSLVIQLQRFYICILCAQPYFSTVIFIQLLIIFSTQFIIQSNYSTLVIQPCTVLIIIDNFLFFVISAQCKIVSPVFLDRDENGLDQGDQRCRPLSANLTREQVLLSSQVEFMLRCIMQLVFKFQQQPICKQTRLAILLVSKRDTHQQQQMYSSKLPTTTFQPLVKTHTGPVYVIKFNNAGEYAMTGSQDRGVCLYNPQKNLMIKQYKNLHNYDVSGLDITKDNTKFVTGGGDKNIILTDVVQGKTIRKYTGHNGRVNCVTFNAENNIIISSSYDTTIRCWDNRANSYSPIDIIKGFKDSVSYVEVRGFEIISGCMDGTIRFYDIRMGQYTSDDLGEAVQSMCVAQSNKAYVASALDNCMYLVEKSSGNKVIEYKGHQVKNYTINCKFNEEDTHIFTGSADGKLYVYDIMKTEPIKVISVSSMALSALDVHPSGGLIGGAHDGSIFYWKI